MCRSIRAQSGWFLAFPFLVGNGPDAEGLEEFAKRVQSAVKDEVDEAEKRVRVP